MNSVAKFLACQEISKIDYNKFHRTADHIRFVNRSIACRSPDKSPKGSRERNVGPVHQFGESSLPVSAP